MSDSEIKILRDALAKSFAENDSLRKIVSQLAGDVKKLQAREAEKDLTMAELKRRVAFYENPHSPPSANSIPTRRKKADRAKGGSSSSSSPPPNKGGASAGHVGASHKRRPDHTTVHRPKKCAKCGSKGITVTKTTTKMTVDIPEIPRTASTNNVIQHCTCRCGHVTTPQVGIDGTSIGKNLMTITMSMYKQGCSLNSIREAASLYDTSICKKTIQNALFALGGALEPEVESWKENIGRSKYLKLDETSYTIYDKLGYVWVCIGDDAVLIHVDRSRAAAVLDLHFPHWDIPVTVDGYAAYNRFRTIQRCRSHILCDAEFEQDDGDDGDEPKTMLYEKLRLLYHDAKQVALRPDAHTHYDSFVISCTAIADSYKGCPDCKFGDKLEKATPNLFTFLKHPGMDPTNNESERMLRRVVISRKIRQRLVTEAGMKVFGILVSCLLTWQKRGTSIQEEILRLY